MYEFPSVIVTKKRVLKIVHLNDLLLRASGASTEPKFFRCMAQKLKYLIMQ